MLTEAHEYEALMRVQEVAHELGQHPGTIYRKIAHGRFRACPWAPVARPSGFRATGSSVGCTSA